MRKQSLLVTVLLSTALLVTGCKSHIPRDVDNDGKPDSAWVNTEGKQSALIIKLSSDSQYLRAIHLGEYPTNLEVSGYMDCKEGEHEIIVTPIDHPIQGQYLRFFNPKVRIRVNAQGVPYNLSY
ncbi:MAG: hypothetical protein NTX24_04635 [Candidatus Pacearchaeota archaeon]|nr:hypothetical protein [Candidatus Pacearchaeota archaeon]